MILKWFSQIVKLKNISANYQRFFTLIQGRGSGQTQNYGLLSALTLEACS